MSTVVDMRRRKVSTLNEMVNEIHRQFAEAMRCDKKAYSSRIYAGQLLLELRARIEAGEAGDGVNWWDWYATKFVRSRKDAEKVMRLAREDDPEAAHEEEKAAQRQRMNQLNAERRGAQLRSNDEDVSEDDPDPDDEPSDDEETDPENYRTAFLLTADVAGEMAAKCRRLASYARESGLDTEDLLTMARSVAAAWSKTVEEVQALCEHTRKQPRRKAEDARDARP
jgi:hypothetical protein